MPPPASGVYLQSSVSPTGRHVTSIPGDLPRASGFKFPAFCEDTSHWVRVSSSPVRPHLNLMTSASTLFPVKSRSQVLGFKMLTIQFSPRALGSCEWEHSLALPGPAESEVLGVWPAVRVFSSHRPLRILMHSHLSPSVLGREEKRQKGRQTWLLMGKELLRGGTRRMLLNIILVSSKMIKKFKEKVLL